jgi:hypothetical protein
MLNSVMSKVYEGIKTRFMFTKLISNVRSTYLKDSVLCLLSLVPQFYSIYSYFKESHIDLYQGDI